MRTLAVPVELLEQAADALEDSRYSGYDWIANALRALLAAPGVEDVLGLKIVPNESLPPGVAVVQSGHQKVVIRFDPETPAPEER